MTKKGLVSVRRSKSGLPQAEKIIKTLQKTAVYVGIPQDGKENQRKHESITNADLGFIHEFGSPAARIPARPFLVPAVKEQKANIRSSLQKAAKLGIEGDEKGMDRELEKLALKTAVAVPEYVTANQDQFTPLKPRTIKARQRKNDKLAKQYDRQRKRMGIDKKNLGISDKITILMDTRELLGAITGVVVKGK